MARQSYLTGTQIADIADSFSDLNATFQAMQDPPVIVTVKRRSPTTGTYEPLPELTGVHVVDIALDATQAQVAGRDSGAERIEVRGEVEFWEQEPPLVLRPDDRFHWDGYSCVIEEVRPVEDDTIIAQFRLEQGRGT